MNDQNNFANKFCTVQIREDEKNVFICDLTDTNNEPAILTLSKARIKKLFAKVRESFNEETTMRSVSAWCDEFAIKTHYWCRMD